MQQLRLQRLHVVVESGREDDVLTGRRNEVDDLIHVVRVAVGKKLSIRLRLRNNHIRLIDDERVDTAKQIVGVELHVAQKQLRRGYHHIGVGVHIGFLLLNVGIVQRHAIHSAAAVARQTLEAVEGLDAQLLGRNEHDHLNSLLVGVQREHLLNCRNRIRNRLSRSRSRLYQDILSGEDKRNGLRLHP